MFDVRLNAYIKRTSGINLEGPSLIRRSRKVWAPPKNGPIAPMFIFTKDKMKFKCENT